MHTWEWIIMGEKKKRNLWRNLKCAKMDHDDKNGVYPQCKIIQACEWAQIKKSENT